MPADDAVQVIEKENESSLHASNPWTAKSVKMFIGSSANLASMSNKVCHHRLPLKLMLCKGVTLVQRIMHPTKDVTGVQISE